MLITEHSFFGFSLHAHIILWKHLKGFLPLAAGGPPAPEEQSSLPGLSITSRFLQPLSFFHLLTSQYDIGPEWSITSALLFGPLFFAFLTPERAHPSRLRSSFPLSLDFRT